MIDTLGPAEIQAENRRQWAAHHERFYRAHARIAADHAWLVIQLRQASPATGREGIVGDRGER